MLFIITHSQKLNTTKVAVFFFTRGSQIIGAGYTYRMLTVARPVMSSTLRPTQRLWAPPHLVFVIVLNVGHTNPAGAAAAESEARDDLCLFFVYFILIINPLHVCHSPWGIVSRTHRLEEIS